MKNNTFHFPRYVYQILSNILPLIQQHKKIEWSKLIEWYYATKHNMVSAAAKKKSTNDAFNKEIQSIYSTWFTVVLHPERLLFRVQFISANFRFNYLKLKVFVIIIVIIASRKKKRVIK